MANGERSKRMLHLAQKWREGTITENEKQEFDQWYSTFDDTELIARETQSVNELKERLYAQIKQEAGIRKASVRGMYIRIVAAASILLAIGTGIYFALRSAKPGTQIAQNHKNDVKPGRDQATLTLADGSRIILKKGLTGTLARQGNAVVSANNGSAVTYTISSSKNSGVVQFNTLSTARGEQSPYPLVLADGTKVWLDAASTITFPSEFSGKERLVKITGQAYFEVVHNPSQPFRVTAKGQTVEDIGTAFNINAYDDEPVIRTTLVSGAAKVMTKRSGARIVPGEAAVTRQEETGISVIKADINSTVAWKNGRFVFEGDKINSIMRQISRWYDVDVIYQGKVSDQDYFVNFSRYSNVSDVLNILELTKTAHFKIEGRRITVMP